LLLDIVNQSINAFQSDCLRFNRQDYPTVHNQGMSDHHLASAFLRRLRRTLDEQGYEFWSKPFQLLRNQTVTNYHIVSSSQGTVWLLSHDIGNAGEASKNKLIDNIVAWHEAVSGTNNMLLIMTDHWLNRSLHSRQLLPWWLGRFPDGIEHYVTQGIKLSTCESSLNANLSQRLDVTPNIITCTHPFINEKTHQISRKYVLLYCLIPSQTKR
jgi:hypothetical protein